MTTASTNAQPRENEEELPMAIEQSDNSDNKATKKNKVPPSNDDDLSNEASASTANPSEPTVTAASTAPARPIKRARTAYFIFTDEKRSEIQAQHPGEGVAVVSRVLGQMWSSMSATDKEKYQLQAAEERERVAKELAANPALMESTLPEVGGTSTSAAGAGGQRDLLSLVLPVARTRKICKLDPEVKGLSREALMLVTKCAELVTTKLALESVRVAQLQNRRKLLPDDVAQVCQTREQFLFLKDDVKDLVQEQRNARLQNSNNNNSTNTGSNNNNSKGPSKASEGAAANTKPLTAYFGGAAKE